MLPFALLEPEAYAHIRRPRRAWHKMAASQSVEVKLVAQIVQIEPEINVFSQRVGSQCVYRPIAVHAPCVYVVAEATINKARASAHVELERKLIGRPKIERVLRRVLEFAAYFREGVRLYYLAVEIGVSGKDFPHACNAAGRAEFDAVYALLAL